MALLALLLSACTPSPSEHHRVLRLTQADFLLYNQATPPDNTANKWQAVTLPDLWDIERPNTSGYGWYRFKVKLNVPPNRLWGIYLPRINQNAAVFINNVLIGADAYFEQNQQTSWNAPLYFTIPNGILHSGVNIIYVRLYSRENMRGRILPIELGPDVNLSQQYQNTYFQRITLSQIVAAFTLTVGICIGIIWLLRRESEYAWFSLGSLLWTFYTSWFFVHNMPVNLNVWVGLTFSSSIWGIACMWLFISAHAGIDHPRLRISILAFCTLANATLLLIPEIYLFNAIIVAYLLLFIVTSWIPIQFLKQILKKPSLDSSIIFLSIMPMIAFGIHDWLNIALRLQHDYILHYSIPFIFLLMGWALLRRFTRAVNEAEHLNNELESKIEKREKNLKQAFDTIHQLEKKKALEKERERIMRDIHDGVGGQLVSALAIIEHENKPNRLLADILNFALDDLRLIIDSLAPDDNNLEDMLYMFKYRYEPRLQHYGIELDWQQDDEFKLATSSPHDCLQILRILQEVFNNILKHSGTRKITVRLSEETSNNKQTSSISIYDHGCGFPNPIPKTGRGFHNIKKRAQEMKLNIAFYNDKKGACVKIIFT